MKSFFHNPKAQKAGADSLLWLSLSSLLAFFILFLFYASSSGFYAQVPEIGSGSGVDDGADQDGEEEGGIALRDLAQIQGVRSNQLLGYGLVVGLGGTGDTRSKFASTAIQNLLSGLGQKIDARRLNETRNIAAVLVTAEIPSFAKVGSRLSARVSSVGDARSLEGGILIQTPLYAGNKEIYAVAQGAVTTGSKGTRRVSRFRSGNTVVSLLDGVIIEKELRDGILDNTEKRAGRLRVSLRHFDFSTLYQIKQKLEQELTQDFPGTKIELDNGAVFVDIPQGSETVALIAKMEKIRIKARYPARVVVNERTGTIVMGGDVRVDPVAISRSGMGMEVSKDKSSALSNLGLQSHRNTQKQKPVSHEFAGGSISELIQNLNKIGANVRDIIAILEALKASGALHAELIVN